MGGAGTSEFYQSESSMFTQSPTLPDLYTFYNHITVLQSEIGSIGTPPRVSTPSSTAALESAVYSVSDRRTPDYHLVDDDSYIDNITQANATGEIIPRIDTPGELCVQGVS